MRYPVILIKERNGTYLALFPDVPDAVTCGDTKEEALAQAQDALLTVFDAYMKDRRDIPPPSRESPVGVDVPALETAKIELYRAMRAGKVGKAELARRLNWHLPQVDRVLNVRHGSQLDQVEAAFEAVGKRLTLVVNDLQSRQGPRTRARRLTRRSTGGRRVHGAVLRAVKAARVAHPRDRAGVATKRAVKKR